MELQYFKFYYVIKGKDPEDKWPIKTIRKEKVFINERVPNVIAIPVINRKRDGLREPMPNLWKPIRLKEIRVMPYPTIRDNEWFTFIKNGDGKVKRVTLYTFLKGGKK